MNNKTGSIYKSDNDFGQVLATKNGYEYFVQRPVKHDMSWVAVNNVSKKAGE